MTDECSITHSRTKHDAASQQTSKKGTRVTAPSFLRKSFYMISNCDHSLADWSDDGTTFVIKAPELFASKILPSYFKHSNLSSFVRQLNFYGFRKIKADPLRLHEAALSEASRFLKFGHLFFVQGREDLLLQIKKEKDKNDKSTGADIVHTRKVNQELKRKISVLAKDIEDLKATHGEMVLSIEDVNKIQRNVEPPCTATTILLPGDASSFNPGSRVQPLMALPDTFETTDWLEAPPEEDAIVSRYDSSESATATIHSTPYTTTHTAPYDRTISPPARDLQQALFRLPLGVQAQLVDRLVHEIQSPRDTQGQIDEPTPRSGATTKRLHAINHSETVGDGNSKKIALLGSNHLDLFLLRESKSLFDTMQPVEPDNGLRHVDNMSNGDFSSP